MWAWRKTHPSVGALFGGGRARWFAAHATIGQLVDMLEHQLQRRVVDATGLKGKYDFRFWWSPQAESNSDAEGPTLKQALQSELGLKLVPTKAPVEILVVDHAEKTPTDN